MLIVFSKLLSLKIQAKKRKQSIFERINHDRLLKKHKYKYTKQCKGIEMTASVGSNSATPLALAFSITDRVISTKSPFTSEDPKPCAQQKVNIISPQARGCQPCPGDLTLWPQALTQHQNHWLVVLCQSFNKGINPDGPSCIGNMVTQLVDIRVTKLAL